MEIADVTALKCKSLKKERGKKISDVKHPLATIEMKIAGHFFSFSPAIQTKVYKLTCVHMNQQKYLVSR